MAEVLKKFDFPGKAKARGIKIRCTVEDDGGVVMQAVIE